MNSPIHRHEPEIVDALASSLSRRTRMGVKRKKIQLITELLPHDLLHRLDEHIAFGWPTVLFKSGAVVGRHRKDLLFHPRLSIHRPMALNFFSALTYAAHR